jgi:hypothetical protein
MLRDAEERALQLAKGEAMSVGDGTEPSEVGSLGKKLGM